jgi:hypothetical protein
MDKATLEKLNLEDLRDKAADVDIEGRSSMDKDELVDALVKHYRKEPPADGDENVAREALGLEPRIG